MNNSQQVHSSRLEALLRRAVPADWSSPTFRAEFFAHALGSGQYDRGAAEVLWESHKRESLGLQVSKPFSKSLAALRAHETREAELKQNLANALAEEGEILVLQERLLEARRVVESLRHNLAQCEEWLVSNETVMNALLVETAQLRNAGAIAVNLIARKSRFSRRSKAPNVGADSRKTTVCPLRRSW